MFETIVHKWLKVPYILHVHEFQAPKHPKANVLLIHGIGTSWKTWEKVAARLPNDARILAVDLLGFGDSPKPHWKSYNVKDQTDSIITTLLRKGLFGPIIIVGHSLGSLVAVEIAKRYPQTVKSLVLCSPPFYRPAEASRFYHREVGLRALYNVIIENPSSSGRLLRVAAAKSLWLDPGYYVDEAGTLTFIATLNAAIVNQTSLEDAITIRQPTTIIYGKLDPLIVERNIKDLARANPHIALKMIPYARHEIKGGYITAITREVARQLDA